MERAQNSQRSHQGCHSRVGGNPARLYYMNIIRLKSFSKIPGLVHGFSTRSFGSMGYDNPNGSKALNLFSKTFGINPLNVIRMDQVHGKNVHWVNQQQAGQKIIQTDGVLTAEKDIYLSV